MNTEQRELGRLAKALDGRGHHKQAATVRELTLIKVGAEANVGDLNDAFHAMILKMAAELKDQSSEAGDGKYNIFAGSDVAAGGSYAMAMFQAYKDAQNAFDNGKSAPWDERTPSEKARFYKEGLEALKTEVTEPEVLSREETSEELAGDPVIQRITGKSVNTIASFRRYRDKAPPSGEEWKADHDFFWWFATTYASEEYLDWIKMHLRHEIDQAEAGVTDVAAKGVYSWHGTQNLWRVFTVTVTEKNPKDRWGKDIEVVMQYVWDGGKTGQELMRDGYDFKGHPHRGAKGDAVRKLQDLIRNLPPGKSAPENWTEHFKMLKRGSLNELNLIKTGQARDSCTNGATRKDGDNKWWSCVKQKWTGPHGSKADSKAVEGYVAKKADPDPDKKLKKKFDPNSYVTLADETKGAPSRVPMGTHLTTKTHGLEFRKWAHEYAAADNRGGQGFLDKIIRKAGKKGTFELKPKRDRHHLNHFVGAVWEALGNFWIQDNDPAFMSEKPAKAAEATGPSEALFKAWMMTPNRKLAGKTDFMAKLPGSNKAYFELATEVVGKDDSYLAAKSDNERKNTVSVLLSMKGKPGGGDHWYLEAVKAFEQDQGDPTGAVIIANLQAQAHWDAGAPKPEESGAQGRGGEQQVSRNDYFYIPKNPTMERDEHGGMAPPVGTVLVSKRNGDAFYIGEEGKKKFLYTLELRAKGRGGVDSGSAFLTEEERAIIMGQIPEGGTRDLWESYFDQQDEYIDSLDQDDNWFTNMFREDKQETIDERKRRQDKMKADYDRYSDQGRVTRIPENLTGG